MLAPVSPSVLSDSAALVSRLQAVSPGDADLLRVVDLALESLNVMERSLRIQGFQGDLDDLGRNLRSEKALERNSLVLWGEVVVTLWRVVMGFSTKPTSWDGLTLRLVIWRCIAGERGAPEGEWARRQATCAYVICDQWTARDE
jgi:hypothetical protein